jgi:hypothetical protein
VGQLLAGSFDGYLLSLQALELLAQTGAFLVDFVQGLLTALFLLTETSRDGLPILQGKAVGLPGLVGGLDLGSALEQGSISGALTLALSQAALQVCQPGSGGLQLAL